MKNNRKSISWPKLARKVHEFTYGLLYPAFFGNMIYDLILAHTGTAFLQGLNFLSALVILFFYALDYMHLYVDVNDQVGKKVEGKTWCYIICDMATSLLFFFAFVAIKGESYIIAAVFIGVIPFLTTTYKLQIDFNIKNQAAVVVYGITSLIAMAFCIYWLPEHKNKISSEYFLSLVSFEFIFYFVYVFYFYSRALKKSLEDNRTQTAKAEVK